MKRHGLKDSNFSLSTRQRKTHFKEGERKTKSAASEEKLGENLPSHTAVAIVESVADVSGLDSFSANAVKLCGVSTVPKKRWNIPVFENI